MKKLVIAEVHYRNFGPFVDAMHDFSVPGLTGVEGVIDGRPGSDSNGSGKSMLVEGPTWCLWGRGLREDFSGDAVVRIGSTTGCEVRTVLKGAKDIVVTRYRQDPKYKNHLYVLIDGKDVTRGTDAETQKLIENETGLDFQTYANTVAFGARDDVKSFFAATDAQRKAVLERLLGLEAYARAQKAAKLRMSDSTTKVMKQRSKMEAIASQFEQATKAAEAVETVADTSLLMLRVSEAELRVKSLGKLRDARLQEKAAAESHLAEEQAIAQKVLEHHHAACAECEAERSEIEGQVSEIGTRHVEVSTTRKLLEARAQKLAGLKSECPTCEQSIDDASRDLMLEALKGEITSLALEGAKLEEQIDNLSFEYEQIVDPDYTPHAHLVTAQKDVAVCTEKVVQVTAQYHEAKKALTSAKGMLEQAQTLHANAVEEMQAIQAKAAAGVEVLKDLLQEQSRIQFWVEGFGNAGLKSFLVESFVPDINARATAYARMMFGPGAHVKLSATTKLKTKDTVREKISIEGLIPGCCDTYAKASKGQKRRLDLSLLLAFRDIIADRAQAPIDQLFADELFDGLDKTGCEVIADILKELSANRPVTLVTHSAWLKSVVDQMVVVRHVGDYRAELTTPGAMALKAALKLKKAKLQKAPAKNP